MSVTVTITYSTIVSAVRNQLSILAKRSIAKDGKPNYDAVSFSGVEGNEIYPFIESVPGHSVPSGDLPDLEHQIH